MMKKVLLVFLDLISLILLIGSYFIEYFSERKLGMVRWVNYKTQYYQSMCPLIVVKSITLLVLLIFVFIIIKVNYKKEISKLKKINLFILSFIIILFVLFILFFSMNNLVSYYIIFPIISLVVLLQLIKNLVVK